MYDRRKKSQSRCSELEDLKYKYYKELRDGKLKISGSGKYLRCPFCGDYMRSEYNLLELEQHASRIAKESKSATFRDKARHLGLLKYLDRYGDEVGSASQSIKRSPHISKSRHDDNRKYGKYTGHRLPQGAPNDRLCSAERTIPNVDKPVDSDMLTHTAAGNIDPGEMVTELIDSSTERKFRKSADEPIVWPWMAVVANLPIEKKDGRYVGESGRKLKDEWIIQGYNPVKVHPLWGFHGHSGFAIVEFSKDWEGFKNAMAFEKAFEVDNHGKRDWYAKRQKGGKLYGWLAREREYLGGGLIGKHLQNHADLKTISNIQKELHRKDTSLMSTLKMKKMQDAASHELRKIYKEQKRSKEELDDRKKELKQREKELYQRQALNENEKRKLDDQNKEDTYQSIYLKIRVDHSKEEEEINLGNRKIFVELDQDFTSEVRLGDGKIHRCEGKGTIIVHTKGDGECNIFDKKTSSSIITVPMSSNRVFPLIMPLEEKVALAGESVDQSQIWHLRYGHLNWNGLQLLKKNNMVICLPEIESKTQKKPVVDHLKIFGSIAYSHISTPNRDKFDEKSEKMIFVGYSDESKGYRLYHPIIQKLAVARDVIFDETTLWNWEGKSAEHLSQNDFYESSNVEYETEHGVPPPQSPNPTLQIPPDHIADSSSESPIRKTRSLREIYESGFESVSRKLGVYGVVALLCPNLGFYRYYIAQLLFSAQTRVSDVAAFCTIMVLLYHSFRNYSYAMLYSATLPKLGFLRCCILRYYLHAVQLLLCCSARDYLPALLVAFYLPTLLSAVIILLLQLSSCTVATTLHLLLLRYSCYSAATVNACICYFCYSCNNCPTAATLLQLILLPASATVATTVQLLLCYSLTLTTMHLLLCYSCYYCSASATTVAATLLQLLLLCLAALLMQQLQLLLPYSFDYYYCCRYLIYMGTNMQMIADFKKRMMKEFEMTDLGIMKYFLGIQVKQSGGEIVISQEKYIEDLLKKFHMENYNPVFSPMATNDKLKKDDGSEKVDAQLFRSLVGSLIYLTNTRPDIVQAVGMLSRFLNEPTKLHFAAAKRIMRYLQGTKRMGIKYVKEIDLKLIGYTDSDWGGSLDDRKSTSGYLFSLGTNIVSWSSKKQKTVALSSAEAEYIAASDATCEGIWLRRLLEDLQQDNFLQNDMAILQHQKADENILKLAEEQKREKELLHKKILELEAKLDQKQALELQIEHIKGAIGVMKLMVEEGDMEAKKKLESIEEELRDKEEELDGVESLNSNLIIKERRTNEEVQEAHKELIAAQSHRRHVIWQFTPFFEWRPPFAKRRGRIWLSWRSRCLFAL
ncbi:hypothetical protein SASPL_105107 [Salvia splendens]|uniref:Uncharacterized protein n=1 Tax=Salvia splendens TaxID=180675 RepID=A0A8X8YIP9_SALSN|nr:hypothetical protein SASPL_105107 [Salvia splendens]